jgi:hypothetical protein
MKSRRRAEQHVLGAAECESRHLDVRPVVDDRVAIEHLADQRPHHSQFLRGQSQPGVDDLPVHPSGGQCLDASGNGSTKSVTVTVPR